MFTLEQYMEVVAPGDILLTQNPAGIGRLINFGQSLEDGGGSMYGHVAIAGATHKPRGEGKSEWTTDGSIYESVARIGLNHVKKYGGKECCIIRHASMDRKHYYKGLKEVVDNLGQPYPAHRIVLHGADMLNSWIKRVVFRREGPLRFRWMKLAPLDWPVCSELAAQFIQAANLRGGWEDRKRGWRGVNPDDFYDAAVVNPQRWTILLQGTLCV